MHLVRRILIPIFCLIYVYGQSQHDSHIYKFKTERDVALIGTGVGLSVLGLVFANSVNEPLITEINSLDASDVSAFDRGAISNYSATAQTVSDVILFSGAALPFITYFSKTCRDQGVVVAVMAVETFLITNSITTITKATVKRYRPFNYNPEVPESIKLSNRSKFSFISGHASNTAAMSFFSAKVISDLHPDMKNKWLLWSTAALIPASISYLRYEAGKHFPTDLIAGYAVGAIVGYMVPSMHINDNVRINPGANGGIGMTISLN